MRADIFESLYRRIFEKLQEKVDSGELTLEAAKSLNDEAYNKYVVDKLKLSTLNLSNCGEIFTYVKHVAIHAC